MVYSFTFGPPDSAEPVTVTIDKALLWLTGATDTVKGPWQFVLEVPDSFDVPIAIVQPQEEISSGGISITLQEVWRGSEETVVRYSLLAPELDPEPAEAAYLFLPDGTSERGLPLQTYEQGDLSLTFPPVREGVTEIELRFGPYLVDIPGDQVKIPLPDASNRAEAPAVLDVDVAIETDAGVLRVDEIELLPDGFFVRIIADEGGTAAPSHDASVSAHDDLGNSYSPRTRGVGIDRDRIEFRPPLDPLANSLTIDFTEFAKVEQGPWNFRVALPD